jgi:hypothetical protein
MLQQWCSFELHTVVEYTGWSARCSARGTGGAETMSSKIAVLGKATLSIGLFDPHTCPENVQPAVFSGAEQGTDEPREKPCSAAVPQFMHPSGASDAVDVNLNVMHALVETAQTVLEDSSLDEDAEAARERISAWT